MHTKIIVPVLALVLAITLSGYLVIKQNQNQSVLRQPNTTVESEENIEVITSDIDTSDWLTYRNEEYGFEVRYPGEWFYGEGGYHFSPVPLIVGSDWGIFVNLVKDIDIVNLDYDEVMIKVRKEIDEVYEKIYKSTFQLVNLKGYVLYQYRSGQNRGTYFFNNNRLFVVSFVPAGEIPIEIYDAFLLDFRFIE